LRNTTERPEAVEVGAARLVGTERERIVVETRRLLDDVAWYRSMSRRLALFGDGRAAERIVAALARQFQTAPLPAAQAA
jgi:UDP-N-acetylglucosamine 2-epimerase (non-hydrolysing)